ncbi:MAG: enoyl-CoA hydratase/isomerase family protein [Syntrophaceae bacterium]|nr:enoyl-CoA hydratase/isomerase family protein [Syntrophaceae bacterium]
MDYKNILLSFEGEIGILTIHRPKALNALNIETLKDIQMGLQEVKEHAEMKVLILTGSGEKAFVAGADIAEMRGMNSIEALNFSKMGHLTLRMIQDLDRPVIAAVNGYALGGGTEIAVACDFIYASENARFGLPEVTLGIFPGFGGTQRIPRLIGKGKAKELILTGKMITAQEAYQMGIVNRVFPLALLMEETKKVALQIAANGAIGVRLAKMLMDTGFNMELAEACTLESYAFSLGFTTEDQKEGMTAFIEKRKPNFKGK